MAEPDLEPNRLTRKVRRETFSRWDNFSRRELEALRLALMVRNDVAPWLLTEVELAIGQFNEAFHIQAKH